jgi:Xaa-Pro aminopeptidase
MEASFHANKRQSLLEALPEGALAVFFAGEAPRHSADAYYPFFASRNYLYLSGVDFAELVLLLHKTAHGTRETLYILPKDLLKERWAGRRYSAEEARALSGIQDIRYLERFEDEFFALVNGGAVSSLWLDLYKKTPPEPDDTAHRFAAKARAIFPWLELKNVLPQLRALRTIKAPCELEAMKKAEIITKAGILAMMQAARPGMYEYELKAAFDAALTSRGVVTPAFQPIISAGANNFCIHYDQYGGQSRDGDMILNDVGAQWDNMATDVSRGWPVNGKFNKEQAALYTAAYNTSNYMFGIIKPGMPMKAVDETVRRTCFEELKKIGLLQNYEDTGKYMWHGGAHHVGWDVHDIVAQDIEGIRPGMVFCVDVGIYNEEWGIGFRLEDNCLVTETGCVNLSADIPRSVDEIEAAMARK